MVKMSQQINKWVGSDNASCEGERTTKFQVLMLRIAFGGSVTLADLGVVVESSKGQVKERKTDVFQQTKRKQLQAFGHIWQGKAAARRTGPGGPRGGRLG